MSTMEPSICRVLAVETRIVVAPERKNPSPAAVPGLANAPSPCAPAVSLPWSVAVSIRVSEAPPRTKICAPSAAPPPPALYRFGTLAPLGTRLPLPANAPPPAAPAAGPAPPRAAGPAAPAPPPPPAAAGGPPRAAAPAPAPPAPPAAAAPPVAPPPPPPPRPPATDRPAVAADGGVVEEG